MGLSGIVLYCKRAFWFSLGAGVLWSAGYGLACRARPALRRPEKYLLSLLFVCYLAALIQITVVRDWASFFSFWGAPHSSDTVQLLPFATTAEEAGRGIWPLFYHVGGNLLWFFPLGFLGPPAWKRLRPISALALAAVCLSLSIEVLQWVFMTGSSDIDDLIYNLGGALAGWSAFSFFRQRKRPPD